MSFLFNASLVKCIKRIFPVVKFKNVTVINNQPTTFLNLKQSVPTAVRYIRLSNHTNAAKTIVFGFSLLGLFGLDEEIDSELKLINTIKRGILYLQVGKHLTYLDYKTVHYIFFYHILNFSF